jgi:hypothetical protein
MARDVRSQGTIRLRTVIGALSGIGTIDLGEAGRLADALLGLVRAWFERVVGRVTKVRGT